MIHLVTPFVQTMVIIAEDRVPGFLAGVKAAYDKIPRVKLG